MTQLQMQKWWQLSLVGTLIVSSAIATSGESAFAQSSLSIRQNTVIKKICLPGKPCNINDPPGGPHDPGNPPAIPIGILNELILRYPEAILELVSEDVLAIQKLQNLDPTTIQKLQTLAPESTQQLQPFLPQLRQQPQQIYLQNSYK